MKLTLCTFQKMVLADLRNKTAMALGEYHKTHSPQVVSFTAPTGAGKTIMMAALMESIFCGDDLFPEQPEAIFVWLSDSPQLNEQSKDKIDLKADRIRLNQCVVIKEDSFDQEMLDDGNIYFLNTQKLGRGSNLTHKGDRRTYSIWETLSNTVRKKSDRLYFIIDEAHRGMQGRDAGGATTIMQKFLKGSMDDNLDPMPVVIGMSATMERFNRLVEGTTSTIRKCSVDIQDVKSSGLLKQTIIIKYPGEGDPNIEMTALDAAADDWKDKWDRWTQYCQEQHYPYVNPVLVVQVQNGTGNRLTDTDLDECLEVIEERTGIHFQAGEVVHTFGQTTASLTVKGLEVRYEEPSNISDDRRIKVVFFKENLSTGWDCPRAETMMSFRHATDVTYVTQLLGRMIRMPSKGQIKVDDTLNNVHLFLPYFDKDTVQDVVKKFRDAEGGDIPTDIQGETINEHRYRELTIHPNRSGHRTESPVPGQMDFDQVTNLVCEGSGNCLREQNESPSQLHEGNTLGNLSEEGTQPSDPEQEEDITVPSVRDQFPHGYQQEDDMLTGLEESEESVGSEQETAGSDIDRDAVMRFINDAGFLTYSVRNKQVTNYLVSLFKLVHLLSQSGLCCDAITEVKNDIVRMIREYVESLKADRVYEDKVLQVKKRQLFAQSFDVFAESGDSFDGQEIRMASDADIDRQFRIAESRIGNEGVGQEYGRQFVDWNDPIAFRIDVILYSIDTKCMEELDEYAKRKFHDLNDGYRMTIALCNDNKIQNQYDTIVADGDAVSKHIFRLPETIYLTHDANGKPYADHLFVYADTGTVTVKLNSWEEGVLEEEEARDDFVCWIRNTPRASWALEIPYEIDTVIKPAYPDFLIIRNVPGIGYVMDILEPHRPDLDDNLPKAQGLARYVKDNPKIGRVQLIRKNNDAAGNQKFCRLDLSRSAVREKVLRAITQDELNHIFRDYGFFS